ncbi:hypothetical protein FOA52_013197 [Chlamydomonas sp. UWO 241]|nr:hypothetical protein FOA52_013197 [Chlamydomonas sp. UWO 241]
MESRVGERLAPLLQKLHSAEVFEGEGGVRSVEVHLMNSQASIDLFPETLQKHHHGTFLSHGDLKGHGQGGPDAMSNFEMAVCDLERKLHKWTKGTTVKRDLRGNTGA